MANEVLIVIILGIFLGFFVQTIVGFAGALVAMPILLFVLDLKEANAYVTLFYGYASIYLVIKEWKDINKKVILGLILSSIVGVAVGTWVLSFAKPQILKKALGVFILLYVAYSYFDKKEGRDWSKLEFLFGFLGGFFSSVFAIGGPLYVILVKNVTPNMKIFRATMFGVLGFVTFLRIPALAVTGILDETHLYYSLYIFPFFILAIILGKKMYSRLNEATLKKGLYVLLVLSGLLLTIKP